MIALKRCVLGVLLSVVAIALVSPQSASSADFCEHGCGVCRKPEGCGGCDPGSPSQWREKYRAAQSKLNQSGALSDAAEEELRERISENLKELGIHSVSTNVVKGIEEMLEHAGYETLKKITEGLAEKIILPAEILLWLKTLADIGYQTHETLVDTRRMSGEAEKNAKEGLQLLDEAQSQIKKDLKTDGLCNDAREKALTAAELDARARDLVKSWEDANGRILDPNFHQPFLNFAAAMEKAKQILTAGSSHGSLVPSIHLVTAGQQATSDEIIINKEQRDALRAEIGRDEKLWAEAMNQLRQVLGIQDEINHRLHTLLDGLQKVTASQ